MVNAEKLFQLILYTVQSQRCKRGSETERQKQRTERWKEKEEGRHALSQEWEPLPTARLGPYPLASTLESLLPVLEERDRASWSWISQGPLFPSLPSLELSILHCQVPQHMGEFDTSPEDCDTSPARRRGCQFDLLCRLP